MAIPHSRLILAAAALMAALPALVGAVPAENPAPRVTDAPSFTAAQAASGRVIYDRECAACHGASLEGVAGPALAGTHFAQMWASGRKTVDDLFHIMRSMMPLQAPRSLTDQQYTDLTAYILSRNGYQPTAAPMTAESIKVALVPPGGAAVPMAPRERPVLPAPPATVAKATTAGPDDADLVKADDSVWLMYNKGYDGTRYSALDQINAGNAKTLVAKCVFQLGEVGAFQASPVVYDGTMYITSPYSTYAIDPATCRKKWVNSYPADNSTTVVLSRGVAIYRGKLFRVTPNGHFIAIDAKTGDQLWDVHMSNKEHGYWLSAAPVAYDGLVFIGEAGADWGANGHIFAFDVETGRRVWTFNVIPTGKETGAETWKKGAEKGGGSMWASFALQPKDGSLYFSVGNPAPDYDGALRPGDNLFTDSVVVVDYKTGKLKWWAQQVPHDIHDWDTAASPIVYDQGGKGYMAVANKGGWVYIYDRKTHRLVAKTEVSPHENIDTPITPEGVHHCPGIVGGVQWNGTAYSPKQKRLYVNSVNWCGTTRLSESRYIEGSSYFGGDHTWDPVETAKGWTKALDAATGKEMWSREARTPMLAALTPTAGDVVFTGDLDGNFLALSATSGEVLYSFNTGGAVAGAASTYLVGGKQYVAITSGNSSRSTWRTTGAMTVVVFALPDR
ncbi:PQQ-binding-like beta-propeller repeat protein [Sphingomonas profundi]|uniref:outer membrane protein assembly factor BamB family protein n=1 Tax=Alterirhizorhabdus profundi TaxID=2681549 RepID=UPI0012E7BA0D|nr:PQQ-binding-like beta-propeller repeat protein [Sphingomonas profundi]